MLKKIIIIIFVFSALAGSWFFLRNGETGREVANKTEDQINSFSSADIDANNDTQKIVLSRSGAYEMGVPATWTVENNFPGTSGNYYIYNQDEEYVMKVTSPIREVGYALDTVDELSVDTEVGSMTGFVRVEYTDPEIGIAHYLWKGSNYFEDSFEITIPFRTSDIALTEEAHRSGEGSTVWLRDRQAYNAAQEEIERIISSITRIN